MAPPHFKVVIAGGGIAGLSLGVMLERAGIDYVILEAADHILSLGGSIYLGPPVMRVMEQLGLLDDLIRHSNYMTGITMHNHALRKLYDILLSRIPAYKILFGKKVVSTDSSSTILNNDSLLELSYQVNNNSNNRKTTEQENTVRSIIVRCEDGSSYLGDILVGADGGASSVRENMFREIRKAGTVRSNSERIFLHPSDLSPSRTDQQCIVGITEPLDTAIYPILKSKNCELMLTMPKDANYTVWYVPMADCRFGWGVTASVPPKPRPPANLMDHPDETGTRVSLESRFEGTGGGGGVGKHTGRRTQQTVFGAVIPIEQIAEVPLSLSAPLVFPGVSANDQPQLESTTLTSATLTAAGPGLLLRSGTSTSVIRVKENNRTSNSKPNGGLFSCSHAIPKYATVLEPVDSTAQEIAQLDRDEQQFQLKQLQELCMGRNWGYLDRKLTIEKSIREQPCPFGGTLGDIVDATSRRMLGVSVVEEKIYRTWSHGRTILVGDACHKFQMSTGHGPTQAIMDAINLANLLSKLPSSSSSDIKEIFQTQYKQRSSMTQDALWCANKQDQLFFNRNLTGRMIRKLSNSSIAERLMDKMMDRMFSCKPILLYLQPVPDRKSVPERSTLTTSYASDSEITTTKTATKSGPFGFLGTRRHHYRSGSEPSNSIVSKSRGGQRGSLYNGSRNSAGGSSIGRYFDTEDEEEEMDLASAYSMSSFAMPPPPPVFPPFHSSAGDSNSEVTGHYNLTRKRPMSPIQELELQQATAHAVAATALGSASGTGSGSVSMMSGHRKTSSIDAMVIGSGDEDQPSEVHRKRSPWRFFRKRTAQTHVNNV
ncbi:hypothetical protein BGZ83_009971 [Gryganskiella cystojenkinii]|nr:hypothetical protein BGZ83_009971 [Gryganskiella cystojenkinii]